MFGKKPFFRRMQESRGEIQKTFVYDIPIKVRNQIIMLWSEIRYNGFKKILNIMQFETGKFQLCDYKKTHNYIEDTTEENNLTEIITFFSIEKNTELVLTVLEYICMINSKSQDFIYAINSRLKIEGIGYKFITDEDHGQIVRVEDETFHAECTEKCLSILAEKKYSAAHKHFIDAYEELKKNKYDDALVDIAQAIESILKTRFNEFKIKYDPKKDALASLLFIAQQHLSSGHYNFHYFKELILEIGRARNKGAHGQQQGQTLDADDTYVRFMINLAAASILFLAEAEMHT